MNDESGLRDRQRAPSRLLIRRRALPPQHR